MPDRVSGRLEVKAGVKGQELSSTFPQFSPACALFKITYTQDLT